MAGSPEDIKRTERELRELITEREAAAPDKKSGFDGKITAKRNERNSHYTTYKDAHDREHQTPKSMEAILGKAPA